MEIFLSEESFGCFEKSKQEMKMFQEFFIARTKLENKIKSQWTAFSAKWQKRFKDELKEATPLMTAAERPSDKITRLLVGELSNNASVCGKVLSVMENEKRSPSAIINRWLADPFANTSCLEEKQFRRKYKDAVEDLGNSIEAVNETETNLRETFEAYHIPMEAAREEMMSQAKKQYGQAVTEHGITEGAFVKDMTELRSGMESFESNRLSVLKQALSKYEKAVNEDGKEREFRKKHVEVMKEYFNGISVEDNVRRWLNSMKKIFYYRHYPKDPYREEDVIQVDHTAGDPAAGNDDGLAPPKQIKVVTEDKIKKTKSGNDDGLAPQKQAKVVTKDKIRKKRPGKFLKRA